MQGVLPMFALSQTRKYLLLMQEIRGVWLAVKEKQCPSVMITNLKMFLSMLELDKLEVLFPMVGSIKL